MKICPEHNKKFSDKSPNKGGFYWHVINFDEGEYCSKSKEQYDAIPDGTEEPTREPVRERDFTGETDGKIRHGLVVALIESGWLRDDRGELVKVTEAEKQVIGSWVEFIKTGK